MIIVADLCNAPSEKMALYWLTTEARYRKRISVLVEADSYAKDIYYKFLRTNGLMDGIVGLVAPEENVDAIRIDKVLNFPNTIIAKYIGIRNAPSILNSITGLMNIDCNIQYKAQNLIYTPER